MPAVDLQAGGLASFPSRSLRPPADRVSHPRSAGATTPHPGLATPDCVASPLRVVDNGGRIGYDAGMENQPTPAPFVGAPDRNPAAERAARRQAEPTPEDGPR